jgi:TatD DNase family protein
MGALFRLWLHALSRSAFLLAGGEETAGEKLPQLIDTHTHLEELEELAAALERARGVGVIALIAVGSDRESDQQVLRLSGKYGALTVYPALGLHPGELGGMDDVAVEDTLQLIEENISAAVAIGEIGLDYHKKVLITAPRERQKKVFRRLLELARKYDKPAIVHSRYSWKDAFDLVKESGLRKAVFHWYTGFSSVLREIVQQGYFISATPAAEYHEEHRRAIKETPLERLLLETDCPVPYGRDTRYISQPADIQRSLKAVASLKGLEEPQVARQTTLNAFEFFALPQGLC